MGREDREPRIPDVHQQHQYVVEGGIRRRIGMFEPLPVPEIQRRFVSMVAVGDVQPGRIDDCRQLLESDAQGPDRVAVALLARDRQPRRMGHGRVADRAERRPRILIERKDRAEIGLDRPREGKPVCLGAGVSPFVG